MTIRLSWPSQASKGQRINYLSPTTKGRYYPIFELDRVLHRGIFNNAGGTPVSAMGTSATYFGGGVLCMEHDTTEKQRWANWATNSYTFLGQGTFLTNPCEYNDLLYTMVNEVPWPPAYPFVADYNGKTHDEIASVHKGDTYIMRLPRGLTMSSDDAGPENGHGALPATPQDAKIPNTPVDWASLYQAGLVYGTGLYKFTRNGKIYYMLSNTSQLSQMPPAFLAMFPNLLTDRVANGNDRLGFMGAVPYDEQWLPSSSQKYTIEIKRGIGPMTILAPGATYYYLLTVTANGKTVALPEPIATLSNGETEWRDTTANVISTVVKIYRDVKDITPSATGRL
ncbi:hypothetical protein SPFM12_00140 [Salmonella phage SPFM12]|nr:hypothetical protein SPFM12_00140 [Salmonella phage SPFM12]